MNLFNVAVFICHNGNDLVNGYKRFSFGNERVYKTLCEVTDNPFISIGTIYKQKFFECFLQFHALK